MKRPDSILANFYKQELSRIPSYEKGGDKKKNKKKVTKKQTIKYVNLENEYNLNPFSKEGIEKARQLSLLNPQTRFICTASGCSEIAVNAAEAYGHNFNRGHAWDLGNTNKVISTNPVYAGKIGKGILADPINFSAPKTMYIPGTIIGLNRKNNLVGTKATSRDEADDSWDYANQTLYPKSRGYEHVGYMIDPNTMLHGTGEGKDHPAYYEIDSNLSDGVQLTNFATYQPVETIQELTTETKNENPKSQKQPYTTNPIKRLIRLFGFKYGGLVKAQDGLETFLQSNNIIGCKSGVNCGVGTTSGEGGKAVPVVPLSNAPLSYEELLKYLDDQYSDKSSKKQRKADYTQAAQLYPGLSENDFYAAQADAFRINQRINDLATWDKPENQTYDRAWYPYYRSIMQSGTRVNPLQILKFISGQPGGIGGYKNIIESNYGLKKQKKGGMIKTDPRGQWAHPGENTRIPGNKITMQGVPYPVWAQANNGQSTMMYPGQEYSFPGADYVDEYPIMQNGGIPFLSVPQEDPEMMYRDRFNTPLTKEETEQFNKWVAKESERQGRDIMMDKGAYDVQGFWKSGDYKKMDKDNHGVDTWKKPNHPTFSNQSKYHGVDGFYGGNWNPDGGYQPSKQTASMYGPSYYNRMFAEEPGRIEHLDASRYRSGANKPSPLYYGKGGLVKYQKKGEVRPSINLRLPKYERPRGFFTGYGFSENPAPGVNIYGMGVQGERNLSDRLNLTGGANTASVFYPGGSQMFVNPSVNVGMKYKFDDGGLTKYQNRGEVRPPIYTEDPNDIRLRNFNDSTVMNLASMPIYKGTANIQSSGNYPEGRKSYGAAAVMDYYANYPGFKKAYKRLNYPDPKDVFFNWGYFPKPVQPVIYKPKPQLDDVGNVQIQNVTGARPMSTKISVNQRHVGNMPSIPKGNYMVGYFDENNQGVDRGFITPEQRDAFVEELRKRNLSSVQPAIGNITEYYRLNKKQNGGDKYIDAKFPIPYSHEFVDKYQEDYNNFYAQRPKYTYDDGFDEYIHTKKGKAPFNTVIQEDAGPTWEYKGEIIHKSNFPSNWQKKIDKGKATKEDFKYYPNYILDKNIGPFQLDRLVHYVSSQAKKSPSLFFNYGGDISIPNLKQPVSLYKNGGTKIRIKAYGGPMVKYMAGKMTGPNIF